MAQIYTIFYRDKAFHLYGNDTHIKLKDNYVEYQVENESDIIRLKPELFSSDSSETVIIKSNCPSEELFDKFKSTFRCIDAAGGLLTNGSGRYLMIFRRGKWDLPKGKVDDGESLEETAIREVYEETGIMPADRISFIDNTYHFYMLKGEIVIKKSAWYLMKTEGCPEGIPQTEEDITGIKWFEKEQLREPLQNSFPAIITLMNDFLGPL